MKSIKKILLFIILCIIAVLLLSTPVYSCNNQVEVLMNN